ncbi:MAG: TIGR03960 family B12-binding radical SAM protein, partial [Armatimonadetes bacterium]|nr:TIGR03960 family B12-binding radical SAM protein [Armatimonadota bacterium]
VGDGEELLPELLEKMLVLIEQVGPRTTWAVREREEVLGELARIEGVYWPAGYQPFAAGSYLVPKPMRADLPPRVRMRRIVDLDAAPFPTAPPVPWAQTTHDRAQIEIARGCVRGCRFCQAGMVYRPVRERSVATLVRQARTLIANTGYDELSLVALNCPDYRRIDELVAALQAELEGMGVSLGLPSLRVDSVSVGLAQRIARVRKGGMTFAPEAGTQRLRNVINKNVTDQDLMDAVGAVFEAGWTTIKLYFMLGLPTETDEDVDGIADLLAQVAALGRKMLGPRRGRMKLNVSVATFNPKPHTPFQWFGQAPADVVVQRMQRLRARIRDRAIHLSLHDLGQSQVEAAIARGDRLVAEAIEAAWLSGAYLDPWREFFRFDRWQHAFSATGTPLEEWATREIDLSADLPWDIIDTGISKEFLWREYSMAVEGCPTPDCRAGGCNRCGVQQVLGGCSGVIGGG